MAQHVGVHEEAELGGLTGVLADNGITISMDGKGAWRDNVFVERLWRSVKYEEVYLRAHDSVSEARASIGRYLDFYNARRPHSSLDGMTPDQAYFPPLPLRLAAQPWQRLHLSTGKICSDDRGHLRTSRSDLGERWPSRLVATAERNAWNPLICIHQKRGAGVMPGQ
jgi:hypothetical protein